MWKKFLAWLDSRPYVTVIDRKAVLDSMLREDAVMSQLLSYDDPSYGSWS